MLAHEWSLARLISLERAGRGLGAEPSMLKMRGSEIQAELGELLMECAGPYALPAGRGRARVRLRRADAGRRRAQCRWPALYLDLRKVAIYGGTNEIQRGLIGKSLIPL